MVIIVPQLTLHSWVTVGLRFFALRFIAGEYHNVRGLPANDAVFVLGEIDKKWPKA
jgi:hypothetical protein